MTLQGYQFDKSKVTPEADAALFHYLAQNLDNKVISGLSATSTGLNIYVAAGRALLQGRLIDNNQQVQLTAQANKSGYVCITIDLTQNNTSTGTPGSSDYVPVNNQLKIELLESLNQQDLNNGGLIYTFPLYSYVSNGTTATFTKITSSYRSIYSEFLEEAWAGTLTSGTAIYPNLSTYKRVILYGVCQNMTQFKIEVDLTKAVTSPELSNRPYVANIVIGSTVEGSQTRQWKLTVGIASDKGNTYLDAKYKDGAGNWTSVSSASINIYKIVGVY
ncbi:MULTISPECIES: hypothetical protein [unclassified Enterococcus]|uniref:hypothetical protein n=1 Tax=unclassified Enterococcus TaxID=2608891 RepID=UPI001551F50C|nr:MULTISPECIES: hypothetical protein [unclassified Enterococcus]MBS7578287.1 hypothetical protein [Enterococcus sp. MMGLQ5-2]MBS7585502.1 hypothetical protein [Enterococcus sp. MMGLQ5-1]NPD13359.1 hypothetical protein [Enterococcus sp. MMGLQ5-1]NPD38118.1 hypothetical protein [Enterococcus sp. MMGLQ5-2]